MVTASKDTGQQGDRKERIFICSPLRPRSHDPVEAERELQANLDRARRACRLVSDLGATPYCPHIYATQFLDDSVQSERERGLEIGCEWLEMADEVWVFSEHISEGMASEIALASKMNKPVRMICESEGLMQRLAKMKHNNGRERRRL